MTQFLLFAVVVLLTLAVVVDAEETQRRGPTQKELDQMSSHLSSQLNANQAKPPPAEDHILDHKDPAMWAKWSYAIGYKFGKTWLGFSLPVESHAEEFCRGFDDQFRNVSVENRLYKMNETEMAAGVNALNEQLNSERARKERLTEAEIRPVHLAKYKEYLVDPMWKDKPDRIEALKKNIEHLEGLIAQDAADPPQKTPITSAEGDAVDRKLYSYVTGYAWSFQFPTKWALNNAELCVGFRDGVANTTSKLSNKETNAIFYYVKNGIKFEKKMGQQKDISTEFLAANKLEPGVVETASGLQYKVLSSKGGALKPTTSSRVVYHVRGGRHRGARPSLDTGGVPREAGDDDVPPIVRPFVDDVVDLIDGLREGLLLMAVGDHYKFWIKGDLAWGKRYALNGNLFPYDVFAVEVLLVDVEDAPPRNDGQCGGESCATATTTTTTVQADCDVPQSNAFTLFAPYVRNNSMLSGHYTCEGGRGGNYSPELRWSNVPKHTESFAVLFWEVTPGLPAAFVHWLLYNIPANITSLPPNTMTPDGALPGATGYGAARAWYSGPCYSETPDQPKRKYYEFVVMALRAPRVGATRGLTWKDIEPAVKANLLASSSLFVHFEKGAGVEELSREAMHKHVDKFEDL